MLPKCLSGVVKTTLNSLQDSDIDTVSPADGSVTAKLEDTAEEVSLENQTSSNGLSEKILADAEDRPNSTCEDTEVDTDHDGFYNLKPFFFVTKHLPVTILDKFDLSKFFQPIRQQVSKISDFLTLAYHPNYGGVNFLSPSQLWEMLKEKKQSLFPNAHLAVFGGREDVNDYPFAYRNKRN